MERYDAPSDNQYPMLSFSWGWRLGASNLAKHNIIWLASNINQLWLLGLKQNSGVIVTAHHLNEIKTRRFRF